jgi:hypothetical protein
MILANYFLPHVASNWCEASAEKSRSTTSWPILACSLSTSAALTYSVAAPLRVNAVAVFSIAARLHVPIWVAWTPYFLEKSTSVISSRIASSATLALNSGEWLYRFFILDYFFRHMIHLSERSQSPRPNLLKLEWTQGRMQK